MRRVVLTAILLTITTAASAQTGKAEQQVLQAEKARFDAMIKADRPALEKLTADDLTYIHSTALLQNKDEFIKSVLAGNIDYVSMVPSAADTKVRINGSTALLTGVAAVNVIDNGKDRKIKIRYTSAYTNRGGAWLLQAWQSTVFP